MCVTIYIHLNLRLLTAAAIVWPLEEDAIPYTLLVGTLSDDSDQVAPLLFE
jgi:hypothetical protein